MSKGKTRGKRKLVIWSLAVGVLIIIIAVYETSKELRRDMPAENMATAENAPVAVEKAQAILNVLKGNVHSVHIINGTKPSSLLTEVFTNTGCGTMIFRR